MTRNPRNWPQRRLPLEPLAAVLEAQETQRLAALCDVTVNTIKQWKYRGIPFFQADRAAVRCGFHPCNIWGDDFFGDARHDA